MAIHNLITHPPRLPLIAASILSADFAHMGDDSKRVLESGADLLHLDVMDGHFVPNLTMGPALCASLRRALPEVTLDAHLMVTEPWRFIPAFAKAGANNLTVHIEVAGSSPGEARPTPAAMARAIHDAGMAAGLAINPPTDVSALLPHLEFFDLILVMSVNPGFSGQAFIDSVLDKVRVIKPKLRKDQRLEMDGGINAATSAACREAGCDLIVAASAIFGTDDYRSAISALRGIPGDTPRADQIGAGAHDAPRRTK